jgi:hypothetical protein
VALPGEALGEIGTDRFRRPAELIRQRELFNPRQFQAGSMHLERQPIGTPEDLKILDPPYRSLVHRSFLVPDPCVLTPETRSFGVWL